MGLLLSNCTSYITGIPSAPSKTGDDTSTPVLALTEEDLPFGFSPVNPGDPESDGLIHAGQSIADAFLVAKLTSIQQYRYNVDNDYALITSGTIEPVVTIERALFDRKLSRANEANSIDDFQQLKNVTFLQPDELVTPAQLFLTSTYCDVICDTTNLVFELYIGRLKSTVFFVYYLHTPGINLPTNIIELSKTLVYKNEKLRKALE